MAGKSGRTFSAILDVLAKKTEQSMIAEYNRQDIEQKLKDGKISAEHKKDETIIVVGKGKGKK